MKRYLILAYIPVLFLSCIEGIENTYQASGQLFIVNKKGNTAIQYDLETKERVRTIPTGVEPHEIDISNNQKYIVITNYKGHSLTVFNTIAQDTINFSLEEGLKPHGMAFLNDSSILCTSEGTDELLLINLNNGSIIKRLSTDNKPVHMMALHPNGKSLFISNKEPGFILEIDLVNWKIQKEIALKGNIEGISLTPLGDQLWITRRDLNIVSILDTESMKIIQHIETDIFPVRIAFRDQVNQAIIVNSKGNSLMIMDTRTMQLIKRISFKSGIPWIFDLLNKTPIPVGITIHKDNKHAFITTSNADKVFVLDMDIWEFVGEFMTDDLPDGLVILD